MKEHFNEKTTLEQLSSLAGYTPTYFQQLFVKTMHVSPQKYLEELRINHAKYLLSQDEQKNLFEEVLSPNGYNLMVTSKDIDLEVEDLSKIVAWGINKCLHESLEGE
jgi:AraC-like DNA-binding protein